MIQRGNAPFGFLTPLLIHTTGWSDKNWSWLFLSSTAATISGERLQGSRYERPFSRAWLRLLHDILLNGHQTLFLGRKNFARWQVIKATKNGVLDILRLTCRTLFLLKMSKMYSFSSGICTTNPKFEVVAEVKQLYSFNQTSFTQY